jgi:hypothetical protein
MNAGMANEAAQYHFWEYMNQISVHCMPQIFIVENFRKQIRQNPIKLGSLA